MLLDIPDPAHARAVAQGRFRLAATLAAAFVGLLWLIALAMEASGLDPALSGVRPRQWDGLHGIVFAPLVHAGLEHLVANSAPLLVLVTTMVFLYPQSVLPTLPAVWLGAGLAVWLFARDSVHFGASGLVYGLASFILVAGVLRRDRRAVAASLVVWFLYGSLVWGVLPVRPRMSWETHLAAALIGVACAVLLRRRDVLPAKRYGWEEEGEEDPDAGEAPGPVSGERDGAGGAWEERRP